MVLINHSLVVINKCAVQRHLIFVCWINHRTRVLVSDETQVFPLPSIYLFVVLINDSLVVINRCAVQRHVIYVEMCWINHRIRVLVSDETQVPPSQISPSHFVPDPFIVVPSQIRPSSFSSNPSIYFRPRSVNLFSSQICQSISQIWPSIFVPYPSIYFPDPSIYFQPPHPRPCLGRDLGPLFFCVTLEPSIE